MCIIRIVLYYCINTSVLFLRIIQGKPIRSKYFSAGAGRCDCERKSDSEGHEGRRLVGGAGDVFGGALGPWGATETDRAQLCAVCDEATNHERDSVFSVLLS